MYPQKEEKILYFLWFIYFKLISEVQDYEACLLKKKLKCLFDYLIFYKNVI